MILYKIHKHKNNRKKQRRQKQKYICNQKLKIEVQTNKGLPSYYTDQGSHMPNLMEVKIFSRPFSDFTDKIRMNFRYHTGYKYTVDMNSPANPYLPPWGGRDVELSTFFKSFQTLGPKLRHKGGPVQDPSAIMTFSRRQDPVGTLVYTFICSKMKICNKMLVSSDDKITVQQIHIKG